MQNNKLWFKAKKYGWEWVPITWEGWLVILAWFLLVIGYLKFIEKGFEEAPSIRHFIFIFISVFVLIYICYKKGEKPHWRWGGEDK